MRLNVRLVLAVLMLDAVGGSRIVGGHDADPRKWPWIVSLYNPYFVCGGTLINAQWVLTAAHCVKGETAKNLAVRLGPGNLGTTQGYSVKQIIIQPKYKKATTTGFDIALLKLSGQHKGPFAPLASRGNIFRGDCFAAGWGATPVPLPRPYILQQIRLPLKKCSDIPHYEVPPDVMCTSSPQIKSVCMGDSGGPLLCYSSDTNRWVQAGISSFVGIPCEQRRNLNAFVRVSNYRRFIWTHARV